MSKLLEYIRSRSDSTKSKIINITLIICLVILATIWAYSIKEQLLGGDRDNTVTAPTDNSVLVSQEYVTIEAIEERDGKKYLYFRVTNDTQDILSFSKEDEITLKYKNTEVTPEKILDRKNETFARKILSNTTLYGVLVFPTFENSDVTITFTKLFFERNPENYYKQIINTDLRKIKPLEELRS